MQRSPITSIHVAVSSPANDLFNFCFKVRQQLSYNSTGNIVIFRVLQMFSGSKRSVWNFSLQKFDALSYW